MLINFFEQAYSSQFKSSFISNEMLFLNQDLGVYLFSCDFAADNYKQDLFDLFGILFPSDLARAVPKRQAEFLAGRYAAREVMRCAHIDDGDPKTVSVGKQRCPVWPDKFIGSITHTDRKAFCTITGSRPEVQIGIDYENYMHDLTASEVRSNVHSVEEGRLLLEQGVSSNVATTIIFSAKESLFKALYPRVGEYFGFNYATVSDCDLSSRQLSLKLDDSFSNEYLVPKQYFCNFELGSDGVLTFIYN